MKADPSCVQESKSSETTSNVNSAIESTSHGWFAKRYLLAVVLGVGTFCLFSLGMNTSIALIEMTKNIAIEINGTIYHKPEFDWNSKEKGLILSVHAYGHISSFLVAMVVGKFGGITTHGCTLFLGGTMNLLYPFIVRLNFYLFLTIRFIDGILETFAFLATFEIWSQWAPKAERSKLLSIQITGAYIATAAVFPISGYLAYFWQWPSIYYVTGGASILVASIMLLSFSNTPSTNKHISESERLYLMKEVELSTQEKVSTPWKEIFTSIPLWALFVMKFCQICGLVFISLCLPLYVKDMTNMEIHNVGILSGIPNILSIITLPLCGWLADYIQNKKFMTATGIHKAYVFIGHILGSVCLFTVAFLMNINFTINVILLIVFKVLSSLSDLVTILVPLYIAPNHSSVIASTVAYAYFLGSSLVPMLMGYLVTSHDPFEWSIFLTCVGAILLGGGIVFIFFGSSVPQSWSQTEIKQDRPQKIDNFCDEEKY